MNPWLPTSPCGPGCLVALDGERAGEPAGAARRALRAVALAAVVTAGLGCALAAPLLGPRTLTAVQQRWTAAVLRAAGVRVERRGSAAPAGALVVANHVSWLDVLALNAVRPVCMLAKDEVRAWPVLGLMAARAGTVFLDRERLRALPAAVDALAEALRAGRSVGVFAEGTTRCGRDLGPFRPAAFQAALDAGAPVVPVAVRYRPRDGDRFDATAAFVGDDTLWSSLRRVLAVRGLVVEVVVAPAIGPAVASAAPVSLTSPGRAAARRRRARRCAASIAAALPPPARVAHPGPPMPAVPSTAGLDRAA